MYNDDLHSKLCSMMFLRQKMLSVHDLFFLNPLCSFLKMASNSSLILSKRIRHRTFPGTDSKVIPLPLLHCVKSPFFRSLTMIPSFHCSGTLPSSHILLNSVYNTSTLMSSLSFIISARMLSVPAALLFFSFCIARLISSLLIFVMSISSSCC